MLFQINSIQYRISNTILVLIISSEFRILWFRDLCILANVHQNETYSCEMSFRFSPLHCPSILMFHPQNY
jgi:hypothetical protein